MWLRVVAEPGCSVTEPPVPYRRCSGRGDRGPWVTVRTTQIGQGSIGPTPTFLLPRSRTPGPAGSAYGFEPVGADGVGRAEAGADALLFVLATPESVFSMDTSVSATFDQNRAESAEGPSVGLTFQSSLRSFRCRREEQLSAAGATPLLHPVLLGPPGEQPHALFGASLVHASMLDGPY